MAITLSLNILADAKKAQKALADTTSDLGELNQSAEKASGGFGKMGSALGDFASTAAGVFAGGALLAGVSALGNKLSDAFSEAIDVEAANDKLAAQLGLGAEASADYGRLAGELYSQAYGDSIADVDDALRAVNQNIGDIVGDSDDAFKNATKSVLDFSAAFGEDVGPTTRAVGQMIRTGLAVDAQDAMDILTVGFQNGANASEDLLDTFNEYGTQFRGIGLNGRDALGLITQAMKAGARDSDKAADALKEFAIRSKDASKLSADSFKALGLNAEAMTKMFAKGGPEAAAGLDVVLDSLRNMEDPVARNAAAVGLFGAQAEDLGDALYAMDPSSAVAALGDVTGAAQKMGDTLNDNAASRIEGFKRTMQTAIVSFIGDKVLPALENVGKWVTENVMPHLKTLGDYLVATLQPKLDELSKFIEEQVTPRLKDFGDFVKDTLVPKLQEFGQWIEDHRDGVYQFAGALAAVGVAAWIASGPIGLIVGALLLLGGLFRYAYDNSELFRDVVDQLKESLEHLWNDVLVPAGTYLKDVWVNDVWPKLIELWETIQKEILPGLEAAIKTLWEDAIKPLTQFITENMDVFKALIIVVGIVIGAFVLIGAAASIMAGLLIGAFVLIGAAATLVFGGLIVIIYKVIQVWWDLFSNARDAVGAIASFVFDKINGIISFFGDAGRRINGAASGMFDGIKEAFRSAINWVVDRWNSLSFSLPTIPGTDIGGFTLSTPDIPRLAAGGIVMRPTVALVGEAGPEAVIPLNRMQGRTTVYNVNVTHTGLAVDSPQVGRDVVAAIKAHERRNGPVFA